MTAHAGRQAGRQHKHIYLQLETVDCTSVFVWLPHHLPVVGGGGCVAVVVADSTTSYYFFVDCEISIFFVMCYAMDAE